MIADGIPLSRANYIRLAGLKEPVSGEQESMLPPEFQKVAGV
jgi:hypothetical protein